MAALAGVVGPAARPVQEQDCRTALAAQRRYSRHPAEVSSLANATFGIAQFNRVNGSGLASRDRPHILVAADICLHNRQELLRQFGAVRHHPDGASDTELFLSAWLLWKERCFDRLAGDYAVALYEPDGDRLVLARDPLGCQPLFYSQEGPTTRFASMPSGLFGADQPRADLGRLARRLAGQDDFGPSTWFAGIKRVLPGELLVISAQSIRSSLHWQPAIEDEPRANRAEQIETYRGLLDEAVRCRIEDQDGPIATHLSAGYDSSAITATAARLRSPGQRLIAYTSGPFGLDPDSIPRGRFLDETEIAASTAAFLGVEHRTVRVGEPLLAPIRSFVRAHQSIATPLANLGWYTKIGELAAAAGARVLLTGEFGNFGLSAGGIPVLREWIRRRQWSRWFTEFRAVLARGDVRARGALFASFSPWLPDYLITVVAGHGHSTGDRYNFARRELLSTIPDVPPMPPTVRGDYRAEILEALRTLDPGTMNKGSIALAGIEERAPAGDRRLLEFCLRLRPDELLDNGVYKPLARAALADRLPGDLLDMKLRGFQGSDWRQRCSATDARAALEEIATSSAAAEVIDLPKLRSAIDRWPMPGALDETEMTAFGLNVGMALATGIFLLELERNPNEFGR